jgi:hypothetical protein
VLIDAEEPEVVAQLVGVIADRARELQRQQPDQHRQETERGETQPLLRRAEHLPEHQAECRHEELEEQQELARLVGDAGVRRHDAGQDHGDKEEEDGAQGQRGVPVAREEQQAGQSTPRATAAAALAGRSCRDRTAALPGWW